VTTKGVDLLAVAASALAAVMTAVYVGIMNSQDDPPLAWVLVALLGAMALTAYAAFTGSPMRRQALVVAAGVLGLLGLLAIFSIGLPILLAGVLAGVAAARARRPVRPV
jgi:hypothetical protein